MTRTEAIAVNTMLRARYEGASNIRHYVGERHDETHVTVDLMPSTDRPGRIYAGYTDELIREAGQAGTDLD